MKELQGTEKQVKWANNIRNNFIEHIANMNWKEFLTHIRGDIEDYKESDFKKVVDIILACDDASTWIYFYQYVDFSKDSEKSNFTEDVELLDDEMIEELKRDWKQY